MTHQLGDALLRSAAKVWLPLFQSELDELPRAADRARQQVPGPDTVRVLIIGNGIANAFGVRTADLALPAALARAIRDRVDRGVEVDLDAVRGMRAASVGSRIDGFRIRRYDAVVVTVGQTDAGSVIPLPEWSAAMHDLLTRLQAELRPGAPVLALSLVPVMRASGRAGWMLDRIEDYATRMDDATQAVIDGLDGGTAQLVPLRAVLQAAGETRFNSAAAYTAIGQHLADVLAPQLSAAPSCEGDPGCGDEDERVAALEASGLLGVLPSDRLARLVRSARTMFGVRGVSLTLVGRERLRVVTQSGLDSPDEPPRVGRLICRVLEQPGVYELTDVPPAMAAVLPRLSSGDVRFYAALAIEAPSGHRVGAICLFDDRPRTAGSVDETAMRELAAGVQAELWDAAPVPG